MADAVEVLKENGKPVYNEEQKELIKAIGFIQKHGLKEKEAVVNRKRVYYFRADKFHEIVLEHSKEIAKMLTKHVEFGEIKGIEDSQRLGDIMINNGLLKCYDRVKDDVKKFKYPKKLVEIKNSMHDKGFYGFDVYKSQTKMTIFAIALALIIIAVILFPLWPYTVKLGIFNVLFYFSSSILVLVAFRLVLWIAIFPFGVDIWIFPSLFDDDAGLAESFMPILLINRREDGWLMFALRILMVVGFAGYWYKESGLPIPWDATIETFNEVFEWGKDRMVGNETTSLQHKGDGRYQNLDDILKETEEYEKQEEEERKYKEQEEEEKRAEEELEDDL